MFLKPKLVTRLNIKNYKISKCFQKFMIQRILLKNFSNFDRENFSPIIKLNLPCNHDKLINHIERLKQEYKEVTNNVTDKTNLVRKSFLSPIIELWGIIQRQTDEISQLQCMIKDLKAESDKELLKIGNDDLINEIANLHELYAKLIEIIIPIDEIDDMDIIVELVAGVGGQEAMLFTQDIFNMYRNFAQFKGWSCEITEYDTTDIGGLRHASLNICGHLTCKYMKYESGVHRVQRVPKTDKSGRIHTSTMTVAVLPQPSEIQVSLDPKDLKIETMRASGAGGQHVNKTESAVRVTHLTTGFVTTCQVSRSQHKNLEHAKNKLRALIYEKQRNEELAKQISSRKEQVGTAARSEKVRTYNYVQDRISDHRLAKNYYNMEEFMSGNQLLNKLIEELMYSTRLKFLQNTLDN